MRYVDLSQLVKPTGWTQRAQAATKAVVNGDDPNKYADVWRELKKGLAALLHGKCWYCESSVVRSDNVVDHFRPKNSVCDAERPHTGYRWLAFDESNFRYACTYCNSRRIDQDGRTAGGKADRFPLVDEAQRVYTAGSVAAEQPLLLDPCKISDWRLLGCHQENGKPCAATADPVSKRRAETSIEILHLHYEPTCKERRTVAAQLMSDVDDGKRLFELVIQDPTRAPDFKAVAAKVRRAIDRESEYSGDMHFLLRGQRSEQHPWIQELLEA